MSEVKQESVMPVISLTPMAATPRSQMPALLAPRQDAAAPAPEVSVTFREARFVSCADGVTCFDLIFDVLCTEPQGAVVDAGPECSPVSGTVVRRIAINNESFAQELNKVVPVVYIEGQEKQKDDTAKRLRELAGIPHRDNFV